MIRTCRSIFVLPCRCDVRGMATQMMRLNKVMGNLNMCSRREADTLIAKGHVTVDGIVATIGQLVDPSCKIEITNVDERTSPVTLVLHKPRSFISQAINPRPGQRFAWQLLTWDNQYRGCEYGRKDADRRLTVEPSRLLKLACCGRLDLDSSGLLLFSQDGRVAKNIIGSDSRVGKHYEVLVKFSDKEGDSIVPFESLARRLRHGLWLDGEELLPAEVSWSTENARVFTLQITLHQGKYRQIRRMCELLGLDVLRLVRTGVGKLTLCDLHLQKVGEWRVLNEEQINQLTA